LAFTLAKSYGALLLGCAVQKWLEIVFMREVGFDEVEAL